MSLTPLVWGWQAKKHANQCGQAATQGVTREGYGRAGILSFPVQIVLDSLQQLLGTVAQAKIEVGHKVDGDAQRSPIRRTGQAPWVGAGKGDDQFGPIFEGRSLETALEGPSVVCILYPAFRNWKLVDIKRAGGNVRSCRHQGILDLGRHYFFPLNSLSHGQYCGLIFSRAQICKQAS